MREPPFIAGAGGGVGTSTLVAALRARDCGIYRAGMPVHVLVCRSTMWSIGCAQRALQHTPEMPVLAIVDDLPDGGLGRNTANRLRMTEGASAIVRVPFVADWRDVEQPLDQARDVLREPEPPKSLRGFEDALRDLVEEIVALDRREPPSPACGDPPARAVATR